MRPESKDNMRCEVRRVRVNGAEGPAAAPPDPLQSLTAFPFTRPPPLPPARCATITRGPPRCCCATSQAAPRPTTWAASAPSSTGSHRAAGSARPVTSCALRRRLRNSRVWMPPHHYPLPTRARRPCLCTRLFLAAAKTMMRSFMADLAGAKPLMRSFMADLAGAKPLMRSVMADLAEAKPLMRSFMADLAEAKPLMRSFMADLAGAKTATPSECRLHKAFWSSTDEGALGGVGCKRFRVFYSILSLSLVPNYGECGPRVSTDRSFPVV